jgi:ubiquinone/menaquinone biosynthesis C-methylase UbiE
MLERILEPEVMDSAADVRDYDSMDHAEVNRQFVADFRRAVFPRIRPTNVEVLDLGTGTAQIPIELCRQDPEARVLAVDLADRMLNRARSNVRAAGVTEQIRFERVDAKQLPYEDGTFAAVMSNSIVHHIPQPLEVLAEAVRVAVGGGLIFVRDLLRPADDRTVGKLVASYAGGVNAHQRKLFTDSLHAALDLDEIRALVAKLGFAPKTVQATSDRHWTWAARKI